MYQYHCLNPIAEKGLGLFDEDYKKTEELEGTDAILVRSAKMHDMELPESVKVIARAGAGVNNIPVKDCAAALFAPSCPSMSEKSIPISVFIIEGISSCISLFR